MNRATCVNATNPSRLTRTARPRPPVLPYRPEVPPGSRGRGHSHPSGPPRTRQRRPSARSRPPAGERGRPADRRCRSTPGMQATESRASGLFCNRSLSENCPRDQAVETMRRSQAPAQIVLRFSPRPGCSRPACPSGLASPRTGPSDLP